VNASTALEWARTPSHAVGVLAVLVAVLAFAIRAARNAARTMPRAVVVAALGAMLCTAYSGDTSWNFARDHLAMHGVGERAVMFAAGELALFAVALMARQNLNTDGAPGTPGVLVWVITGVQVIPAYSESGIVAGTVRAFVGPVLAALLWHLAMGIELRHAKPGAASQGLLAVLTREVRERLLSWLGLSVRGRDAAQITRDRWTRIATHRAARLADLQAGSAKPWRLARARRRLAVAVDRTDAGVLEAQRTVLLDRLAAYRGAAQLASMEFAAPWGVVSETVTTGAAEVHVERVPGAQPETYPALPLPVPEPVPVGARLLPIVSRDEPPTDGPEVRPEYTPASTAEQLRERIGDDRFSALWPDYREPGDDSPPPPGEDSLTPQARRDFLADLMDGRVPGIRALKDRYAVGQARATRIRDELKASLT
jgi:hypothetical protein